MACVMVFKHTGHSKKELSSKAKLSSSSDLRRFVLIVLKATLSSSSDLRRLALIAKFLSVAYQHAHAPTHTCVAMHLQKT